MLTHPWIVFQGNEIFQEHVYKSTEVKITCVRPLRPKGKRKGRFKEFYLEGYLGDHSRIKSGSTLRCCRGPVAQRWLFLNRQLSRSGTWTQISWHPNLMKKYICYLHKHYTKCKTTSQCFQSKGHQVQNRWQQKRSYYFFLFLKSLVFKEYLIYPTTIQPIQLLLR